MHYKILTNEGSYNSYLAKSFRFRIIKHLLSTFHMMSSFSPQKCIHLRFLTIQKKISSLVGTLSTVTIGYIKIHFRFFDLAWETFSGLPFPSSTTLITRQGASPVTAVLTLFQFLKTPCSLWLLVFSHACSSAFLISYFP